jgi:hypothetical protein
MKMGHILKSVFGLAAAGAMTVGLTGLAEAGRCKGGDCAYERYGEAGDYDYVTAEATFGGKSVTAPVRAGRWGEEVRLPGGSWVDCEVTCEYTLRRWTVDFWQGVGPDKFVSPGYFRFDYDMDTGEVYRRGPAFLGRY